MFERLRRGLKKTRDKLREGLKAVLSGGRRLDEGLLDDLEETLYTSDLGPTAVELIDEVRAAWKRREVESTEQVVPFLREAIRRRLGDPAPLREAERPPTVVLVVGVNGSGKTTTIAKLAHRFTSSGRSVVLAACDTFRAAAADQLALWAESVGARLVRGKEGADPASVAFDAARLARDEGADVLIVDTAGRLHTQAHLMDELAKIRRVLARHVEGAPHEVLLVLDATVGQNAIQQAERFTQAVEVTGLVLAKLDGTAKGGAALTIRSRLGIPVKFVGVGERAEDLEPFDPAAYASGLL